MSEDSPERKPVGRFDHIGIAVHSIDAARPFFEGVLGAKFRVEAQMGTANSRLDELIPIAERS